MRIGVIVGVLLVALGTWIVSGRALYKSKREVLRFGDLKASVDEEHSLPPWTGVAAIGAGVVLLVAAGRRKT